MDTSSSSSSPQRRRRALHFDAPVSRATPLVTRPGRSRGHLHRVDPYAAIASGSAAFQPHNSIHNVSRQVNDSQVEATATSSSNTATNVNPGGHLSLRNLTNFTDRFRPLNASDEVASLAESSQHSSSSSSVFTLSNSISSSESNTNNHTSSTRQPLHSTTTQEGHSTSANVAQNRKRSTVSRSITWANAINLVAEQQQESLTQSKYTSIGIGIGPMNHHHPLQNDVLPVELPRDTANLSLPKLVQQKGMNKAIQFTLRMQSKKLKTTMNRHYFFHNSGTFHKLLIVLVPILLVSFSNNTHTAVIHKHAKKHVDKLTKPKGFEWSPNRRLNNRHCVLNMFIDKQAPDEFNPDYEEVKPGAKNKDGTPKLAPSPPKLEKGTYRTKGQVKLIKRFISSVADSFRSNLSVQQHLVFAGSRDGGHLAEEALKYWPPRGKFHTKLYIIADDEQAPTVKPRDHTDRALQYGPVDSIEQRFQNHVKSSHVHIFDSNGEKAGLVNAYVDDDDVAVAMEEEMFHANDDDTFATDVTTIDDDSVLEARRREEQKRRVMEDQDVDGSGGFDPKFDVNEDSRVSYFSLKKLLNPYLEREGSNSPESLALMTDTAVERTKHVIPYLHVDGISSEKQFAILQSARPLLLDETISVVGVENPGDMDVNDLINFFHSVRYKTFLLGKRQLMRIDHLCDETLKDLMNHPYIAPKKPSLFRRALQKIGLASIDHYSEMRHPHPDHEMVYPPFFVAFPRGRTSYEEMTIQHMYDLFGGGGGGGQIATANDRKLPTKKK